jgi:hypothetical protein
LGVSSTTLAALFAFVHQGGGTASAQSFNIDFGNPGTAPAASYGAAGLPGVWNVVGALPPGQRQNLVDLAGTPGPANVYQVGGAQILNADAPGTTGDDQALIDDMFIGFNNPLDVCIWIENLTNGDYQVLIYAMTPGDPSLMSRVRVDDGTPGPTLVGGAWPGSHVPGVTYASFTVPITNGVIGLHSGLIQAVIQSGINGIQVRPLAGAAVGDAGSPRLEVEILVSPNPASSLQQIALTGLGPAASELEIVDPAGRIVWRAVVPATHGGRQELTWDGRGIGGRRVPAGTYFLRLDQRATPTKLLRLD